MLQTLSQKGIWVNVIALIAAIGTASGVDLGLDAQTQAEIVAGILALVNVILHAVAHKREKAGAKKSGGSINTSIVLLPLVLCVCLVLGACASMPAPHTPRQTLAYTESSYTAVVEDLNDLHAQGVLTPAQEAHANTLVQQGNAALDAAHAALGEHDTSTLQGRLSTLDAVLVQLRNLIAREAVNGQ